MIVRARELGPLVSVGLLFAAVAGLLAAAQPTIAVVLVAALVMALIAFGDLAAGFAALGFLSFLNVLTVSTTLSPSKGVGLLLVIAWLARFSVGRRERDFFSDHAALTWMGILFLMWMTVTLCWATSLGTGVEAISRYLPNLMLLPIAYTAVRTRRDLKLVIAALILGAVVAALFGILKPPNLASEGAARATGTVGDPNELAAALVIGLGLSAGFLLARGESILLRLGGAVAIPICAIGIFLSLSRGGLIAVGATLVAGVVIGGRWRIAMGALLALVAVAGVLYFTDIASPTARERVTTFGGGSGRSSLWTLGERMVSAHPLDGVGVGNFPIVSSNYVIEPGYLEQTELIFSAAPKVAHNTYLEVLTEMGIPGLILFMGIVGGCVLCAWRAAQLWAARGAVNFEAIARGVLLGLIGMLVADFFISQTYDKLVWTMFAICPAMLALARFERDPSQPAAVGEPGA